MKNIAKISVFFIAIAVLFQTACVDKTFNEPEYPSFSYKVKEGYTLVTLKELKEMHTGGLMLIDTNIVFKATIIANGYSGNYYKRIVLQDSTADGIQDGIEIDLNSYGLHNRFPIGQLVYVECKGLYLGTYGGLLKIGLDYEGNVGRLEEPLIDKYIFKDDAGKPIKPKVVLLSELGSTPTNTLVKLENVQFKFGVLGKTFADAVNKETLEMPLADCDDNSVVVRSSGYANFAASNLPTGSGSLIVINGEYNGKTQLLIRNKDEIDMFGQRCGVVKDYLKDFEDDDLNSPGGTIIEDFVTGEWTTNTITGSADWSVELRDGNFSAKISNYSGGSNLESENWLISPSFDLTKIATPILNFRTQFGYDGPDLEVKISTDYIDGNDPTTATWVDLPAAIASGSTWSWAESGDVNLSAYKVSSVYIAYVYKGLDESAGSADGKTWKVDDISIANATK